MDVFTEITGVHGSTGPYNYIKGTGVQGVMSTYNYTVKTVVHGRMNAYDKYGRYKLILDICVDVVRMVQKGFRYTDALQQIY